MAAFREEIMEWAKSNGHLIFTHDLDFGAILAANRSNAPSVIQIRIQDVSPAYLRDLVIATLNECKQQLEQGALISVDEKKSRARILPLIES